MTTRKSMHFIWRPRATLAAILVFLVVDARNAWALDYKFLLAPPKQATNATCQSYVLAIALAMLNTAPLTTYEWKIDDEDELRRNEAMVRSAIEREMRKRLDVQKLTSKDNSTRDDWRAA